MHSKNWLDSRASCKSKFSGEVLRIIFFICPLPSVNIHWDFGRATKVAVVLGAFCSGPEGKKIYFKTVVTAVLQVLLEWHRWEMDLPELFIELWRKKMNYTCKLLQEWRQLGNSLGFHFHFWNWKSLKNMHLKTEVRFCSEFLLLSVASYFDIYLD